MPARHEPTEITRAEVKALASFGNTQEQICTYLDIDDKTLHKYYRRELDTALIQANAQVAKRLFNKAVAQDDLSAQIFWLKTRARWRTDDVERLQTENDDLKYELRELRAKLAKDSKSEY
jgi:cell division septum initiation protein DivIVA